MNVDDVVREIAKRTGFQQYAIKEVMRCIESIVYETVPHEEVKLMRGLVLSSRVLPERKSRNPRSGETITAPPKKVPKATFSRTFKEKVANS